MKLIDLHVHSTASDGTLSPSEVAFYAKKKGLSAIALTDHDTISGIKACSKAGLEAGITVVPGIEFSADFYGKELHILGYYIDPDNEMLTQKLEALIAARGQRNVDMIHKLNELGMAITLEDCMQGADAHAAITRAHVAKALLDKGYVSDRKEAFSRYIGDGKPAFVPKARFTVKECTTLIHQAGGLAVLAHPMLYGYGHKDLTGILTGLVSEGINGIECLYATHTKEDTTYLLTMCDKLRLFSTGGSDFHGENKPLLDIGSGYGELAIPFALLQNMQKNLADQSFSK